MYFRTITHLFSPVFEFIYEYPGETFLFFLFIILILSSIFITLENTTKEGNATNKSNNHIQNGARFIVRPDGEIVDTSASDASTLPVNKDFITVSEFSELKSIDEEKLIQMLADGFYIGRLYRGSWFVHKSEANK